MRPFTYTTTSTVDDALDEGAGGAAYLAGGTTLVDLMKLEVLTTARVLDINRLPLRGIRLGRDSLFIGALERMSDVAANHDVATLYPVISEALLRSASPQLRNMASIGGNLLQRTRCGYFRDTATPCNRRVPGTGCPAIGGVNRTHAILGTSEHCVATHPSDLAVAMVAMDASVALASRTEERLVRLAEFYHQPGTSPQVENDLRPGELVTGVVVPRLGWARRSTYVKIRDRQSYEFALTSVAAAMDVRGRIIADARIAAGGVGTTPWRLPGVERALVGRPVSPDTFTAAAAHAADGAKPLSHNGFKIELLRRTIVRALLNLAG